MTSHNNTLEERTSHYIGYTSMLNGKSYLNVVLDEAKIKDFDQKGWDAEKVDGYFFVKYQLEGDRATVWSVNEKAKREAIKAGTIQGIVKENNDIRFTDTVGNMAKFISKSGDNVWNGEPGHMERMVTAKK